MVVIFFEIAFNCVGIRVDIKIGFLIELILGCVVKCPVVWVFEFEAQDGAGVGLPIGGGVCGGDKDLWGWSWCDLSLDDFIESFLEGPVLENEEAGEEERNGRYDRKNRDERERGRRNWICRRG